jgi:protocatechuate 3,4-dioxygenase beta subunit
VTSVSGDCSKIPTETAGPYPGDGSNGPDILSESGVVRSDIRTSIGAYSGTAEGVPMTLVLQLEDVTNNCAPLKGAAVYAWHCTRDGKYSMYTVANENFLRGIQITDDTGTVTFKSIFPGCYSGRWPHIHFEVYPTETDATTASNRLAVSQVALPEDICSTVYATTGYEASTANLKQISLAQDNVFGDDSAAHQLATISGDVASGITAKLVVGI